MKIDVDQALDFFDFVVERHRMYLRRQAGLPQAEWTENRTLATRKFTNVFRWLDPGSQFVLTDLLTGDPRTDLYRCTFYRYTNWPETWTYMRERMGEYPTPDMNQQHIYDLLWTRRNEGHQMFSGAYMIIPQPGRKGDKLRMVVDLANQVLTTFDEFIKAETQAERHAILTSHFGVGKFLGLQILTDFMYQHGDVNTEDEFVIEGPGSWKGAGIIAPGQPTVDVIRWAHEALVNMENCPTLGGVQPSLMDVQNCLCEMSKYIRGPRNTIYRPAHPGPLPKPVLPTAYGR